MAKKAAKSDAAKKEIPVRSGGTPKGMMADVQDLIQLMVANDVTEIHIADGRRTIALKRGGLTPVSALPMAAPVLPAAAPAVPAAKEPPAENLIDITSPMVGTFYAAPSPDSEPYVEAGSKVNANTVVCIVEAMKVMNEIKAECSGTIVEVCVKNTQAVEFGQVMFRVKPN
jgi:acetyl-CoA carboxylase biotin carboxyl carrier protein